MKVFVGYLAFLLFLFICLPIIFYSFIHDEAKISSNEISVYNKDDDKIITMDLEEYIISVVSAEMPADFSLEALKAQSVAARTYALRKLGNDTEAHNGADICTDYAHCQAFVTKDEMKKNWGDKYREKYNKIENAVFSTKNEVLKYNDEFATTVFHSCSNGMTEKASDVWGGDIEYLINVESEGDKNKKDYVTYAEFSAEVFKEKIEEFCKKDLPDSQNPIGEHSLTSGGNVAEICLFGEYIKGTDIRKIFSLKSSAFELSQDKNVFKFTVYGSGHGVGMSQYGADKMGSDGKDYREILSHYYPGTEITLYKNTEK